MEKTKQRKKAQQRARRRNRRIVEAICFLLMMLCFYKLFCLSLAEAAEMVTVSEMRMQMIPWGIIGVISSAPFIIEFLNGTI